MRLPGKVSDNLYFLVAEVSGQVADLAVLMETAAPAVGQRLLDRAGYASNLRSRVNDSSLTALRSFTGEDSVAAALRAVESIAAELERITGLCHDCVGQLVALETPADFRGKAFIKQLKRLQTGIRLVEPAMAAEDTATALRIGRLQERGRRKLERQRLKLMARLRARQGHGDLVKALFINHHLAEMQDALTEISGALISAKLGHRIAGDRYQSLRASVAQLGLDPEAEFNLEKVADTRSGSGITALSNSAETGEQGYLAIFKDGHKRKLKEERQAIARWQRLFPGIAPRILSYEKQKKSAALLIEHLPGQTFDQLMLHASDSELRRAFKELTATLRMVWQSTRQEEKVAGGHLAQLRRRLDAVYQVHPELAVGVQRLGNLSLEPLDILIGRLEMLETEWSAPFSVLIHGDFNIDNVIYDDSQKRINYIDLHRSRQGDFAQDVAVFMVSNYRMQALDPRTRQRVALVASALYRFARDHAQQNRDTSFELRLALALARSLATSARFILDQAQAARLFLRARYLMERLLEWQDRPRKPFVVPVEDLFSA